jgi:hypothetical protein
LPSAMIIGSIAFALFSRLWEPYSAFRLDRQAVRGASA